MTKDNSLRQNKATLFIVAFVFSAFFSYFYLIWLNVLPKAIPGFTQIEILQFLFTLTISVSLVFASFRINKLNSLRAITYSLISTIIVTSIVLVIPWNEVRIVPIFVAGVFVSIGQLGVLTYFWTSSQSQKRGFFGGLIGLFTILVYFVTRAIAAQTNVLEDSVIISLAPIALALAVTIIHAFLRPQKIITNQRNYYPEKRTVILFLVPWLFFCFINSTLARNIALASSQAVVSDYIIVLAIQTLSSLIGALIGGSIADFSGRRLTLFLSVTLYGLSMAFSGFAQDTAILFVAFGLEGLSWGIFLTLYNFVVWGDLGNKENFAKMYAVGLAVYFVSLGFGQLPTFLSQISPTNSALIGCSVIFLSNLSIVLAPELLPLEARKMTKLKSYIRKVRKVANNQN